MVTSSNTTSSSTTTTAFLVLLVSTAMLVTVTEALPRTRTVKTTRNYGSVGNAVLDGAPTCERNVPCGWALYHQRWRSALRPIFQYTRNTFCSCSADTQCVYQENRSEMRAYVFYCRQNDPSKNLYPFPDTD